MLGKWSPEEPSKEEIEGTKRQKINDAEKHGLMISLQRNGLLALCLLISVWIRMILLIFARAAWQCACSQSSESEETEAEKGEGTEGGREGDKEEQAAENR